MLGRHRDARALRTAYVLRLGLPPGPTHTGSSRFLLVLPVPVGSSRFLRVPPGSCWFLPVPPGSSWAPPWAPPGGQVTGRDGGGASAGPVTEAVTGGAGGAQGLARELARTQALWHLAEGDAEGARRVAGDLQLLQARQPCSHPAPEPCPSCPGLSPHLGAGSEP